MYANLINLENLFTLDFFNLKSRTIPDIEPIERLRGRIELISSLCPNFYTEERIGLCSIRKVICPAWECELIKKCKKECIENCLVLSPRATFFTEFPGQMEAALEKLTARIEHIRKQVPDEAVVSWFSELAEGSAQIALTRTPYELIEAVRIWQWLYNTYGKLNLYNLDASNYLPYLKQLDLIWRCMLAKRDFEQDKARIGSGDAVLALSDRGVGLLDQLRERPTQFIDEKILTLKKAERTNVPPLPGYDKQTLWTAKMVHAMRWCVINTFPLSLIKMSIADQFREMETSQLEAISKEKSLSAAEDIRLSLPLYGALFYMSRYAAINSSFFQDVIRDYEWLPDILENNLGLILDHRIWDNTLIRFKYMPELRTRAKLLKLAEAQSERWPISSDSEIFLASALLLAFAAKNKLNILAKNNQVGRWFEDLIESELNERRVPIVSRNLQIPGGEIDFICFDSTRLYIIEAKDYGPRGKGEYFSSANYEERNKNIEHYLDSFINRISWIRQNGGELELPKDAQIYGVFVSSCEEPHIKIPQGIISIPNRRLCSIFGGEPIDPTLKMRAFKAKKYLQQEVPSIVAKSKEISFHTSRQMNQKIINEIFEIANHRIESLFGDMTSFQLYRIAWEICVAFSEDGVSLMELWAEPRERPRKCTQQYLFFIASRDGLSLSNIKVAYKNLLNRGLLIDDDSHFHLGVPVPRENWQFRKNRWSQINSAEDADLILFDAQIKKDKILGKFTSFVDAISGHPKTLIMFKVV